MGFRCALTGKHVEHVSPRLVRKYREKTYPKRYRGKVCIDQGGHGMEIAREYLVDPAVEISDRECLDLIEVKKG